MTGMKVKNINQTLNCSKLVDFFYFIKLNINRTQRIFFNVARYSYKKTKTNNQVKSQTKSLLWRDKLKKAERQRLKKKDTKFSMTVKINPWCWLKKKKERDLTFFNL